MRREKDKLKNIEKLKMNRGGSAKMDPLSLSLNVLEAIGMLFSNSISSLPSNEFLNNTLVDIVAPHGGNTSRTYRNNCYPEMLVSSTN